MITRRSWDRAWLFGCSVVVALYLVAPLPAVSQFMYLDSNADGQLTADDSVSDTGAGVLDVWLLTNVNGDGTSARSSRQECENLTVNSYSFILRSEDGEVEFGEYTNLQPTMTLPLPLVKNTREIHVGFVGPDILSAGKYHLGRLSYRVINGNPRFVFAARSEFDARFITSFGSRVSGRDDDNTLKFSAATRSDGRPSLGDWSDTGILGRSKAPLSKAQMVASSNNGRGYSARIQSFGSNRVSLELSMTRPGTVRAALYDVRGRLVSVLADSKMPAGVHAIAIADAERGLIRPAGVYFYRVVTIEGTRTGRVVLLH